jgi:hypothetical protein
LSDPQGYKLSFERPTDVPEETVFFRAGGMRPIKLRKSKAGRVSD